MSRVIKEAPLPLKLIPAEQQLDWFPVYFNKETQDPWPLDDDDEPINPTEQMEISGFGLKRLSAGDMTNITNKLYRVSRKGKQTFEYGTASEQKILAACKKVKNVGDIEDVEEEAPFADKKEIPFTQSMLRQLPNWVSDALLDHINAINNLTLEMEED